MTVTYKMFFLGSIAGIPNQRRLLRKSPSDRIGSNFTPTAKHLSVAGLREWRRQVAISLYSDKKLDRFKIKISVFYHV